MKQYIELVETVLNYGELRSDRTGVGTLSYFGTQSRYDLREGFPLLTTKKINFDNVVYELLWFLSGSTNVNDLKAPQLWEPWRDDINRAPGDMGPIYGKQWRRWEYAKPDWNETYYNSYYEERIDQISEVIRSIQENPFSRRHVVSAWKVEELSEMALPPCHILFQFYVSTDGHLDLHLYQRSGDIAIGVPYNIASYSLLLTMVAQECNLTPRYFIHSGGDMHIFEPHLEKLKAQIAREPKPLPVLFLNKKKSFDKLVEDQDINDFRLVGYTPHPFIKYELAV